MREVELRQLETRPELPKFIVDSSPTDRNCSVFAPKIMQPIQHPPSGK